MDHNHVGRSIFVNATIGLIGAFIGFGVSQVYVVGEVKANTQAIEYLKDADINIRRDMDSRINATNSLISDSIKLNQEIIGLVKVQNELLKIRH